MTLRPLINERHFNFFCLLNVVSRLKVSVRYPSKLQHSLSSSEKTPQPFSSCGKPTVVFRAFYNPQHSACHLQLSVHLNSV